MTTATESSRLGAGRVVPLPAEDTYGVRKRLDFFVEVLNGIGGSRQGPLTILDVGCGTGELVALPLAALGFTVVGLDVDERSISHAKSRKSALGLPHVSFYHSTLEEFLKQRVSSFDVAICSEVLEHVEDPPGLLWEARSALKDDGTLLVTVPNGSGPFEWEMLLWALFDRAGLLGILRKAKRMISQVTSQDVDAGTLATDSPHLHFFSFGDVKRMLEETGFEILNVRHRTVFCGPLSDRVFQFASSLGLGSTLRRVNNVLADHLPRACVSDWMIMAQKRARTVRQTGATTRSVRTWVKLKRCAHGVEAA